MSTVGAVYEDVNKLILENAEKKQALEWPINDFRHHAKAFSSPQIGGYVQEINSFTSSMTAPTVCDDLISKIVSVRW